MTRGWDEKLGKDSVDRSDFHVGNGTWEELLTMERFPIILRGKNKIFTVAMYGVTPVSLSVVIPSPTSLFPLLQPRVSLSGPFIRYASSIFGFDACSSFFLTFSYTLSSHLVASTHPLDLKQPKLPVLQEKAFLEFSHPEVIFLHDLFPKNHYFSTFIWNPFHLIPSCWLWGLFAPRECQLLMNLEVVRSRPKLQHLSQCLACSTCSLIKYLLNKWWKPGKV